MAHMIMENDTQMTTRILPWHYEETKDRVRVLCEYPNSKEALHAAGLDWEVMQDNVRMAETGLIIPHYKANYRLLDDGSRINLGIVSDRYQIIQNTDAFEFTDSLIGEFEDGEVRYETAGSLQNGKKIWLLAKMPTTSILGDEVDPYIAFCNSHDGKGAVTVCMTPVRICCANTMNYALQTAQRSWSTKHIGSISEKLEEAKYCLGMAKSYMDALNEDAERMVEKRIEREQIDALLDEILGLNAKEMSLRKRVRLLDFKADYFKCLEMPDIKQFDGTVYQAVQAMADLQGHRAPARTTATSAENRCWSLISGTDAIINAFYDRINRIA